MSPSGEAVRRLLAKRTEQASHFLICLAPLAAPSLVRHSRRSAVLVEGGRNEFAVQVENE